MDKYNDKFKTIRVRVDDYNDLLLISQKSQVPLVGLIHIAIPKLKAKYRIRGEQSDN